ncbi:solute carrier family 13 member 2-like [Liolophura sinensis]|uniref:solute carrier family 13 member 2-like n=1 Tax=Liolophura sinensis TaxID=3198878 RepID=UPI00315845E2
MLGMMLPTWFLSMWISNTATTAMMLPIVQAILVQLQETTDGSGEGPEVDSESSTEGLDNSGLIMDNQSLEMADVQDVKQTNGVPEKPAIDNDMTQIGNTVVIADDVPTEGFSDREYSRLCKGMSLCIAYAANVGGISTLIGTGPNVVLQGQAEILFQKYGIESGVSFGSWMIFGFPTSLICVVITWIWLQIFFLRCSCLFKRSKSGRSAAIKAVIRKEYDALGPITFAEAAVLAHFIIVAILWLTRRPQFISGWGDLFPPKYVGDSTAAILVACILFIFPSKLPRVFCCGPKEYDFDHSEKGQKVEPLLTWKDVHHGLPWMIVWLLGGGFALAAGSQKSGLSSWIGQQLTVFGDLQPWVMVLIITFIAAAVTEVTSNTAITTIITPILGELGLQVGVNPLYLMFPAAIATSFAFMLPVATPPNAIVFSHGHVKVKDMAAAGFMLNIVCVLVLNLATNTWANAYFNFDVFPEQMLQNSSLARNTTSLLA